VQGWKRWPFSCQRTPFVSLDKRREGLKAWLREDGHLCVRNKSLPLSLALSRKLPPLSIHTHTLLDFNKTSLLLSLSPPPSPFLSPLSPSFTVCINSNYLSVSLCVHVYAQHMSQVACICGRIFVAYVCVVFVAYVCVPL